jgi:hypothetical protein
VLARGQDPAEVELPEVVEVPQMAPAGMEMLARCQMSIPAACSAMEVFADYDAPAYLRQPAAAGSRLPDANLLQRPAFLRRDILAIAATPEEWAAVLAGEPMDDIAAFVTTATAQLPEAVKQALVEATGADEDADDEAWQRAVLALLAFVLEALPAGKLRKLRGLRQGLAMADASLGGIDHQRQQVEPRLPGLTAVDWSLDTP